MHQEVELIKLETTAIYDIQRYMINNLNCRVHGNDIGRIKVSLKRPLCDFTRQKAFITALTQELESLLAPYNYLPYEEILFDNKKEPFSAERLSPYVGEHMQTFYFYQYQKIQGELVCSNILCVFSSLDSISTFVKTHRLNKNTNMSEFSGESSERLIRCFKETSAFVYNFHSLDYFDRVALKSYGLNGGHAPLGKFSNTHLEKMLHFDSPCVCSILPYLLSAYIYNFNKNHLVRRGTTFLSMAFDEDHVSSDHASKLRKQLKRLGDTFRFPTESIKWCDHMPLYKEVSINDLIPPQNPQDCGLIMWKVFIALIYILSVRNASESNSLLKFPIDYEKSFLLFNQRTGIVHEPSYQGESITSFLKEEIGDYFSHQM